MADFECLVAIIQRSIDVIREEMKAHQEKMIAQINVNQEAMEAILEEMKATVKASQERMEAAINSIHPNW
jgi:aspartate ammonia-lyase